MRAMPVWEELAEIGTARSFAAGDHLIRWNGSDRGGLVAIIEGVCKIANSTVDGREVLVTVRGAGEVLGELSALTNSVRSASVVALTPVRASMVDVAAFDHWLDTAEGAGRRLATVLAHRLVETTRPESSSHQPVEVRVADRILFLADRFAGSGVRLDAPVEVPLTHDDYAAWVGATRAVTTRALGSLREQGHIDFGRGWIQVADRPALERLVRDA